MPAGKLSVAQIRTRIGKIGKGTPVSVTGATNATPPVVTATAHGLQTGDTVNITGVGGNTNCNVGANPVTVVDANSFSLDGIAGNSAYTSGGSATRLFSNVKPSDLYDIVETLDFIPVKDIYTSNESTVQVLVEAQTII